MARILIEAIQNGQENLAKDIIMKCGSYGGIDSQTSRRDGTALFFCCSRGYLELAKLLLDRGASVSSTDKNRATPLHGAVDNGHLDVVKLLISHGADVNAQTYRGDTPLHLAAYRGFGEITQCLVEAGADFRLVNSNSFTAENEAVGRGHRDVCNYLRSAHNVRQLEGKPSHSFNSMIQLDPPSIATSVGYQPQEVQRLNNYFQQVNTPQHLSDVEVQRRNQDFRSDTNLRSKSWDYNTDRFNNLSVISLDPPSDIFRNCDTTNQRRGISYRHSAGRPSSTILLPSIEAATYSQLSPNSLSTSSPLHGNVSTLTPSVFSSSNIAGLSPAATINRPISASPQILNPLAVNYTMDAHRRPSIGSSCSCFSDLSGSDAGSLPSSGSDGSGFFSDIRREDIELQDRQLVSNCVGDQGQDTDLVLLSLGVRNPPSQNHKRQLSTTSESLESSDYSDIYDSALFSLTSLVSGSLSSSVTGSSSASVDFRLSGEDKNCKELNNLKVNDLRPKLNRATSENCSFPSPNITFKFRPDYNKSISTECRPKFIPHLGNSEVCPNLDRMPSNDLSSSCSMSDKPSCSMTCVNIPLN